MKGRRATLLAAACGGLLLAGASGRLAAAPVEVAAPAPRSRNVILVTVDGFRIQELFAGMDDSIARKAKQSGIYDPARARRLYWRDTPEERRLALMPFFWGTLAPKGVVLGDKVKGSSVTVTNGLFFSAPGYAEILTGQAQDDVTTNDVKRYPHATVLEYARRRLGLSRMQVATIGSWEGFGTLASREPDVFFTNTGYEKVPREVATPRMAHLSDLQTQIMALWEEGRSDAVTFGIALEYLKKYQPRLLYIALGESDDWAHARRYDRLLDYIQVFDGYLRRLWEALQASKAYRDRTTLIITTDHGRGVTAADWVDHGEGIEGSQDIWVAIVGPGTPPRGELAPAPPVHQSDVAATILKAFGLEARDFNPLAGPPIEAAFGPAAQAAAP